MSVQKLIEGHKNFKQNIFKRHEKEYIELVQKGQKPKVLFIGCSDSRIHASTITDSNPGDFFVVRNVGNIVPPYNPTVGQLETASAIEYAVNVLGVSEIIVCGHSNCGACEGLYKELDDPGLSHLKQWIELNHSARQLSVINKEKSESEQDLYRRTEHVSVVCQLKNLSTYPFVQERIGKGELQLHGWWYNIEKGEIEYYDTDKLEFRPLEEYLTR